MQLLQCCIRVKEGKGNVTGHAGQGVAEVSASKVLDYAMGSTSTNCTPTSLFRFHSSCSSSSARSSPIFYHPVFGRISYYGHLADSVAPCAAHPGLGVSSGWSLAAFNTRTGDSLRWSIRYCCYWWRCVCVLYQVLKL